MKLITVAGSALLAALVLAACSKKPAGEAASSGAAAPATPGAAAPAAPAPGAQADAGGTVIPADQVPSPRGGWWEQVKTENGKPPHTDHSCESGKRKAIRAGKECTRFTLKKTLLGDYVFDGQCAGNGVSMAFHMRAAGDFNSHYTVDSVMKMQMPNQPEQTMSEHTEARYLGACPAGETASDDNSAG